MATCLENTKPFGSGILCRFCLNDQFEEENPLITPCDCSGSMKFVHFQCLKTWVLNEGGKKRKIINEMRERERKKFQMKLINYIC